MNLTVTSYNNATITRQILTTTCHSHWTVLERVLVEKLTCIRTNVFAKLVVDFKCLKGNLTNEYANAIYRTLFKLVRSPCPENHSLFVASSERYIATVKCNL